MELVIESSFIGTPGNEVFYDIYFSFGPSFGATRVVENESWIVAKHHLIANVVHSPL